jgi:hypothetical protein
MSTFDSADLFGSGPHRFSLGIRGQQLARNSDVTADPASAGLQAIGSLDGEVLVRGRLVAADDAGLQALIDAIAAKLDVESNLVDNHSNTYADVTFISFAAADRTDRGRDVSLGYTARFLKFRGW